MSYYFITIFVNTLDWRDVCRSRHIFNDCIQKFLNTLVSVSRSTANRYCCTFTSSFSKNCFELIYCRDFVLKIHHHKFVIQFTDLFNQFCMVKLSIFFHVIRDFTYCDVITLVIIVDVSFHFHKVDDSLEIIFFTDW